MVPPCSDRVSRAPPYSISSNTSFRVLGYHRLWPNFPERSTNSVSDLRANPRSLAATKGISVDFFSSGYLDVSVPRVRFVHLCIQCTIPASRWVSPFGNPRIKASLQAPRGLSHATTSFIASYRLGIHHMRFNA